MKISYPLKTSVPVNFVEPLVKHLQEGYDMQTAYSFKPLLGKICQLRTKATSLQLRPESTDQEIDKYIDMLSAYTKYALIIFKRFNWDTEKGNAVRGVDIMWRDSFQPKVQYHKDSILIDVFCCYYNISVMCFMRAMKLSQVDLDSSRKQAMTKAKTAAFLVKQMKEKYYGHFNNSGFNDTNFAHLDIIQNICLGIIYKCLYNNFKSNQFKIGINKIAAICQKANQYFLKAYSVASSFFMNPSGISDRTKTQLLSISYIESLFFDVQSNTKYAKYYSILMEKDATKIPLVIAYERKAQRLLNIGLKNQSVEMLFNENKAQKTQLMRSQQQIGMSLQRNIARNQEIYKQAEIKEENIPPPEDFPQQWVVKLAMPASLIMENQGEFSKLLTEQAYALSMNLVNFSNSRKAAMQSSIKKIDTDIQKLFNDSYVNFYTQLQSQSTVKTIPKTLQEKLHEVKKKGGKVKLQNDVKSLKDNQAAANKNFMHLKQIISDEEYFDGQKRSQYGNRWNRPPSSIANKEYLQRIENLQKKTKVAVGVDEKILDKYKRNVQYIDIMNSNDQAILNSLPKPEASKFIQANKQELDHLKSSYDKVQEHRQNLNQIGLQIADRLKKQNYPILANTLLTQKLSQQQIFKTVFKEIEELINKFNEMCKTVKDQAGVVSQIAISLNNKNKEQEKNKREFQEVIGHYNEVSQLYGQLTQSGVFYTKLNEHIAKLIGETEDFAYARKVSAEELEASLNKKGGGGFVNNLPDMYPNKKKDQIPQFTPPPPPASFISQNSPWQLLDKVFGIGQAFVSGWNKPNNQNQNQGFNNQGNPYGFMDNNPWNNPNNNNNNYQPPQQLNFNSNPFDGPVFPSGYGHPNNRR